MTWRDQTPDERHDGPRSLRPSEEERFRGDARVCESPALDGLSTRLCCRGPAYDYVWVIEEDANSSQGSWDQLFRKFNGSPADLIAHIRRTRNGMAALETSARLSTRLIRAIRRDLARIDNRERGAPRREDPRRLLLSLCSLRSWCATRRSRVEWLAVYRAKCAWSGAKFEKDAETWFNPTSHGLLYHPVKLHAPTSGRDFAAGRRDQRCVSSPRTGGSARRSNARAAPRVVIVEPVVIVGDWSSRRWRVGLGAFAVLVLERRRARGHRAVSEEAGSPPPKRKSAHARRRWHALPYR